MPATTSCLSQAYSLEGELALFELSVHRLEHGVDEVLVHGQQLDLVVVRFQALHCFQWVELFVLPDLVVSLFDLGDGFGEVLAQQLDVHVLDFLEDRVFAEVFENRFADFVGGDVAVDDGGVHLDVGELELVELVEHALVAHLADEGRHQVDRAVHDDGHRDAAFCVTLAYGASAP